MITVRQKGSFQKTIQFMTQAKKSIDTAVLDKYGKEGVAILMQSTPTDSGETAASWTYAIETTYNKTTLYFSNTNIQNDVPIAIILQYGHATKNGGWVQGIDYINPAMKPVFDDLAQAVWKEVTNA